MKTYSLNGWIYMLWTLILALIGAVFVVGGLAVVAEGKAIDRSKDKAMAMSVIPSLPSLPKPMKIKHKSVKAVLPNAISKAKTINMAALKVQVVTNGNNVMVYITDGKLGPVLPPSWMLRKSKSVVINVVAPFSNRTLHDTLVAPGPHWTDSAIYEFFPPDPAPGKYFVAHAEDIPFGTVYIEGSKLDGVWTVIYSRTWTDPSASLGLTILANMTSYQFRLRSTP